MFLLRSPTQRDQYDDILVMVDCTSWSNPYPWLPALHLSLRLETSSVRWGFGRQTLEKKPAAACPHREIDWIGAPTSYTPAKRCDWKRSIPLNSFVSLFPLTKRMNQFFASPLPTWLQIQFSKDRNCRCFHQSISLPGSTLGLHDWKVFLPGWCWSRGYWKYRFILSFPVLRLNRPFVSNPGKMLWLEEVHTLGFLLFPVSPLNTCLVSLDLFQMHCLYRIESFVGHTT